MIIKKRLTIKVKGYTVIAENLDIAPADYSVGIMGDTLEGFDIISVKKGKKNYPELIDKFYNDENWLFAIEKAIFDKVYELERIEYKKTYQRMKKRGYKGSYSDWANEYT